MTLNADFKTRLTSRKFLLGAFIKTPHPIVIEVMGRAGYDFLALDAEHAPFDRAAIDLAVLAGRASGCPILVRVPAHDPSDILNALDCGAAGVIVPHVKSAGEARALARSMRYECGGRGLAGTTRAGNFGFRPIAEHVAQAGSEVALICQIEDAEGLDACAEIAAVDGVDALFVGRADLALSLGFGASGVSSVDEACVKVMGCTGAATGLYCAGGGEAGEWRRGGASLFIVGSDHTLMISGTAALRALIESNGKGTE